MSLTEQEAPTSRAAEGADHAVRLDTVADGMMAPALRRLEALCALGSGDRALVRDCAGPPVQHRPGADLGDDGDASCRMLLSGWACRVSETPWGGRQILDFILPGDAVGLSLRPRMDGLYRVVMLCRGATVDARPLRDRLRADDGTHAALTRACLLDERMTARRLVEHTSRLGGASATQAMAHLLLELRGRLAEVGMLEAARFPLPLSQDHLHEALGITVTQVYRVLTQMRRDGLIAMGPGWCEIANPAALAAAAGLKQWRG